MTTKDRILKSALKLFAKQGIERTTTDQISEKAGVAAGTLYVHFKNKQELVDSLYIQLKNDLFGDFGKRFDEGVSVEENLKNISRGSIEHLAKNYDELVFLEIMYKDPQVSESAFDKALENRREAIKIAKYLMDSGELKNLSYKTITSIYWNFVYTVARLMKEEKKRVVDEKTLDMIWDAVRK